MFRPFPNWPSSGWNTISEEVYKVKHSKGVPRQAEVAHGVPGRLRPRIFLTLGTTSVVGRQPYAPAAFTPGEIPGTHFQRLSRPQGSWFCRGYHGKNPQWQPRIDPGTVRLVTQRYFNHNWRNISTIYIYNKTSIKRNILTIKQNTSGSRSG